MGFDLGKTFSGVMDWAGGLFETNEDQAVNPLLAAGGAGILGYLFKSMTGGSGLGGGMKFALIALLATAAINWLAGKMDGPDQSAEYDYGYDAYEYDQT